MIATAAANRVSGIEIDELLLRNSEYLDLSHRFSDFDIRIFENGRFRIEILVWLGGSTSIHQHAFSGAFALLSGRSLHIEYGFDARSPARHGVLVGDLGLLQSEVLEPGAVRAIESGPRFIHANFHMTHPTITMVIRTHQDYAAGAQLNYLAPHFAVDPLAEKDRHTRQQRLVELLVRTRDPRLIMRGIEALWPAEPTFAEIVDYLRMLAVVGDRQLQEHYLDRAACICPELADELAAFSAETARRQSARLILPKVQGDDPKFLISLLLNLSSRSAIFAHLAKEFPNESPADATARILDQLTSTGQAPCIPSAVRALLPSILRGDRAADISGLWGITPLDVFRPLLNPK